MQFHPVRWVAFASLLSLVGGCFAPQTTHQKPIAGTPSIVLSSEQLTSPSGEMSARLPSGWVIMDAQEIESPNIFAVVCSPAYTVSIIFSEMPIDETTRGLLERGGEKALVTQSYERRQRRSNGRATMTGEPEEFAIGRRRFSAYTYTTDSLRTVTRVALCFTQRHVYECAITQLPFGGQEPPDVATMTYIHQVVLGGIEW